MNEVGIFIPLKVKSASEYEIINTAILLGCFVHHNFMTFGGNGTFEAYKNNKVEEFIRQTEKNKNL